MKVLPRSLFGRTALTVAVTLLAFLVIALGTAVYFIEIPMAKRSADDFAALIVSSANALHELPEEQQAAFRERLLTDNGLIVADQQPALDEKTFDLPYYIFFRQALARRIGGDAKIVESTSGPLIWVDIPVQDKLVRLGFDRRRVGTNPYTVLILAGIAGAFLTWLVGLLEVRRVRRPLEHLSTAAQKVGRGEIPTTLPEDGPEELAQLAAAFNKMAADLQELSENRTVIVAGISHDLRTPMTRMGIAIEMLEGKADPELVSGIRRDLTTMNDLIAQFLDFSRGIEDTRPSEIDLRTLIDGKASDLRRERIEVSVTGCDGPCPFFADPFALERLLDNLLENAAHHGGGKPIDIDLRCDEHAVAISIADRGPGIPADQLDAVFRPFVRLESARSGKSGGSGLGLAIARQLALRHGWTIELLPREGGGTVARVGLPLDNRR